MTFFVHLLTSELKYIVEQSFYLTYYVGIQPSEVDHLTTYEFNEYLKMLNKVKKDEQEHEMEMAKLTSFRGIQI